MSMLDGGDDETAFDDIAMSLLLFFPVLSVFRAGGADYGITQDTVVPPEKAKKARIHGPMMSRSILIPSVTSWCGISVVNPSIHRLVRSVPLQSAMTVLAMRWSS